mmetsp:Transcript_1192/g.3305  ORF Transcript_1192/g.3305 Transcript_1192/m.3305 type:complete len:142 (+) Transcript_1192:2379-2804(+)
MGTEGPGRAAVIDWVCASHAARCYNCWGLLVAEATAVPRQSLLSMKGCGQAAWKGCLSIPEKRKPQHSAPSQAMPVEKRPARPGRGIAATQLGMQSASHGQMLLQTMLLHLVPLVTGWMPAAQLGHDYMGPCSFTPTCVSY